MDINEILNRLKAEKTALREKIERLQATLDSGTPINPTQLGLMLGQACAMRVYAEILNERISDLEESQTAEAVL